ncbi:MAG: hypothetical protein ACJ0GQ_07675 [Parasynechococcus sp.]
MDSRSGVILICGLGGLGQACLRTLMGFDAEIHCIDQRKPRWVDGVLAERYRRQLTIGDMRSPQTLRLGRAGGRCTGRAAAESRQRRQSGGGAAGAAAQPQSPAGGAHHR